MKTQDLNRFQVVVTEDYSGNTNDAFSKEVSTFETLEEAHAAYKQKRIELYGEYSSY